MNDNNSPTPIEEDQKLASYIAMVVRNAIEDFHSDTGRAGRSDGDVTDAPLVSTTASES